MPSGPGLQGLPPGCEHASDPADGGRTTGSDGCPRTDGNQPVAAVASCSSGIMHQWHHAALASCTIACIMHHCSIVLHHCTIVMHHCIIVLATLHHCTIASCHIKCNTTQHDMAESTKPSGLRVTRRQHVDNDQGWMPSPHHHTYSRQEYPGTVITHPQHKSCG